jgi:hypothetical protein
MFSKIPGLKRTSRAFVVFAAFAVLLSCSSYNNNGGGTGSISHLSSRAFVSNPVHPNANGGGSPVLDILDDSKDQVTGYVVSLATQGPLISDAGMMSVSPNHDRTLVMSPRDQKLGVVDNVKESIVGTFTLPALSESFFVWTDNRSVFIAMPGAAVTGQAPGLVEKLDSSLGTVTATLHVPGAHYLIPSPDGNQILVFSDNTDTVVLLTAGLTGTAGQPTTISQCTSVQVPACTLPATFDRPVSAVFSSSGSTAYVLNCGQECGGTTAGITAIDMTNTGNPASVVLASKPLPGATTALLQGTQLYVAGTQAGTAGTLSVLNLASGLASVDCTSASPVNCAAFGIKDGYHNQMQMGANGQLFVGSRFCSNICLSIFDTLKNSVATDVTPALTGDVTGLAPIPNRNVVYVCQGGELRVYDTTTDQLANIKPLGQPNVVGQAVDVKAIDF